MLQKGILAALGSALLFGAGTPLAKLLLNHISPWLLAGLLYLGSGIGLTVYRFIIRAPSVKLEREEIAWFAAAILAGGVIAPVLLMLGLTSMPASGASLLLNMEGVFTTLLAWFVFKENFDRRIALGMALIVVGALTLSWPSEIKFSGIWPSLAVLGACFSWGLDNNLTRKISLSDAAWIASIKGLIAGSVNLILAFTVGATLPSLFNVAGSMFVGFFAYGVSLALFVVGLRHLGTARTGAYFSVAPFFGALLAIALGDPITLPLIITGILMAAGIWLHLSECHEHLHEHTPLEHEHEHSHDEHHQHTHAKSGDVSLTHTHRHSHEPIEHSHSHFPDVHHQHDHDELVK
ncbi:DMT family transporter [Methylotenera versatilis]|uniref:DMT family transporter n=1 Tax=Methylotenera versatilis TaxID=1055487 RepID=UPI00064862AD|nr:DMT family transporter [Methylotenera versatilis]